MELYIKALKTALKGSPPKTKDERCKRKKKFLENDFKGDNNATNLMWESSIPFGRRQNQAFTVLQGRTRLKMLVLKVHLLTFVEDEKESNVETQLAAKKIQGGLFVSMSFLGVKKEDVDVSFKLHGFIELKLKVTEWRKISSMLNMKKGWKSSRSRLAKRPTPNLSYRTSYKKIKLVLTEYEKEIIAWLDKQTKDSVLYVALGSGGTLTNEQLTELAWGLEMIKQQFIMVVRKPSDYAATRYFTARNGSDDPKAYLPEGFVERTNRVGLLVSSWASHVKTNNLKDKDSLMFKMNMRSNVQVCVSTYLE
nr:anthocyanidin 3-O-glucosyltransferase 5-like [Tanacetum cinerariifolium]